MVQPLPGQHSELSIPSCDKASASCLFKAVQTCSSSQNAHTQAAMLSPRLFSPFFFYLGSLLFSAAEAAMRLVLSILCNLVPHSLRHAGRLPDEAKRVQHLAEAARWKLASEQHAAELQAQEERAQQQLQQVQAEIEQARQQLQQIQTEREQLQQQLQQ
eukprot:scaffold18000_cov18-Tisochrysis_lutea.AAC.1